MHMQTHVYKDRQQPALHLANEILTPAVPQRLGHQLGSTYKQTIQVEEWQRTGLEIVSCFRKRCPHVIPSHIFSSKQGQLKL